MRFRLRHHVDSLSGGDANRIKLRSNRACSGGSGRHADHNIRCLKFVLLGCTTGDGGVSAGELRVKADFQFGAVEFQVHVRVSAGDAEGVAATSKVMVLVVLTAPAVL